MAILVQDPGLEVEIPLHEEFRHQGSDLILQAVAAGLLVVQQPAPGLGQALKPPLVAGHHLPRPDQFPQLGLQVRGAGGHPDQPVSALVAAALLHPGLGAAVLLAGQVLEVQGHHGLVVGGHQALVPEDPAVREGGRQGEAPAFVPGTVQAAAQEVLELLDHHLAQGLARHRVGLPLVGPLLAQRAHDPVALSL